jgi:signal transduction histidine kinase
MLGTLNTIGILAELLVAGILFPGIYTFLKKFLEERQSKDLYLFLTFVCLAVFAIGSVFSQIFNNMGGSLSVLINTQKVLVVNFLLMSWLLLMFISSKFKLKLTWLILLLFIPTAFYGVLFAIQPDSQITLNWRSELLEPLITFGQVPNFTRQLWAGSFMFLALFSFWAAARQKGGQRALSLYSAVSAILITASYLLINFYARTGMGAHLIASWIMLLLGAFGIMLSEIIPPGSEYARHPLGFLRSRILFKLLFIFILLIVVLFEITALATTNMGQKALFNSMITNYQELLKGVDDKIEDFDKLDPAVLQKLVSQKSQEGRFVYILDKRGVVIAHPDSTLIKKDLSDKPVVKGLLAGKSGWGNLPVLASEFEQYSGEEKFGAYLPIQKFGGGIIVEQSKKQAFASLRQLEANSLLFTIAGIVITIFCGIFFARSIEKPIMQLTKGTEAVSRGELNYRISLDSADEIGRLAAAFNKMTKDLKDSQERLIMSEKLASLGTMAAGMAHEIKNPLVSLRTFSQILQQKWDDPEFREKFSQIVPNEIERINKIAESLLKFGRPVKTEFAKVDLNSLLEDVLTLFENETKKNNIHVTTKFAQLPEITGDPSQLQQAFVNIILNAIQAMEETKGGELTVKTDVGEVLKIGSPGHKPVSNQEGEVVFESEVERAQPLPAVFVEVSDTGPGIEPDKIKQLFDPFFTTKSKGTGMGLPITLRSIEEHKGSIKVKSQLGKGTTFLITLPQRMDQV